MFENDIFKINLSIVRLNSIKENKITPTEDWGRRIKVRKNYKEKAIDILFKPTKG